MVEAVVDHVLVDLVGDREDVVPLAQLGDDLELAARENLAGRVVRAVEDDRLGPRREGARQAIGIEREVGRLERHEDRLAPEMIAPGP